MLDPVDVDERWAHRYPKNKTNGLWLMLDADEAIGGILYDRSKLDESIWRGRTAELMRFDDNIGEVNDSAFVYFEYPSQLPPGLSNWDRTNAQGDYLIENVKYANSGSTYTLTPSKTTDGFPHDFLPPSLSSYLGDNFLLTQNNDFVDVSNYDVWVKVVYQELLEGNEHYGDQGIGQISASQCPVEGVSFEVDGVLLSDAEGNPLTTDGSGMLKLSLTRGNHTVKSILETPGGGSQALPDHSFVPSLASIFIHGPIDEDDPFVIVDNTERRVVGAVVAADVARNPVAVSGAAQGTWDAIRNNFARVTMQWVPEGVSDIDGEDEKCQAVKVVTDDVTGTFDVRLLPVRYRFSTPSDLASRFENPYDLNPIAISGWAGQMPIVPPGGDPVVKAFEGPLKASSDGHFHNALDVNYMIINSNDKELGDSELGPSEMVVAQEGEDIPLPNDNGVPIADVVYLNYSPPPSLRATQVDCPEAASAPSSSVPESGAVSSTNTVQSGRPVPGTAMLHYIDANGIVQDMHTFLGTPLTLHTGATPESEGQFVNPQQVMFQNYVTAIHDGATEDYHTLPYAFGAPIVQSNSMYCTDISVVMEVDYLPLNAPRVEGEVLLQSDEFYVNIFNGLAKEPVKNIPMTAAANTYAYDWQSAAVTDADVNSLPYRNWSMSLHDAVSGAVVTQWFPWNSCLPNGYSDLTHTFEHEGEMIEMGFGKSQIMVGP